MSFRRPHLRFRLRCAVLAAATAAAVALAGCAGDDDLAGPDAATDASIDAAPAGTVTVSGTVPGSDGLVLLGILYPTGGTPQQPTARLCEPLTGDPATISGVFHAPGPTANPCDLGDLAVVTAGSYQIYFGTYVPGQQIAQQCATIDVVVTADAPLTVPMPTLGTCP